MKTAHPAAATGLIVVEGGLAALGVLLHYFLTAEYGDITDSALEGLGSGFSTGTGAVALLLVAAAGLPALLVSAKRWQRLVAVAIPALMLLGMLTATPLALREKREVQYDATPQCLSGEDMGLGPGTHAERESQQAFASIEHVGYFGGGGASGVGGCDRRFVLTEDVDVLAHYRAAVREAGWRVVEDDAHHLRAERDGMAFEVVSCGAGGVVWAGRATDHGTARCDR